MPPISNRCPACQALLIAFELDGVELDHCIECRGTWLDQGELEQIAMMAGVNEDGDLARTFRETDAEDKAERNCPRCGKRLEIVTQGLGDHKTVIDRCPRGDGLWLDRGELAALLQSSSGAAADEAVKRFLADLFRHELEPSSKGA